MFKMDVSKNYKVATLLHNYSFCFKAQRKLIKNLFFTGNQKLPKPVFKTFHFFA